jgi:hypothetical protein
LTDKLCAGFCERLLFHMLDLNLRSGLPMHVIMNGEVVPEETARQLVAHAQKNGFLPLGSAKPKP